MQWYLETLSLLLCILFSLRRLRSVWDQLLQHTLLKLQAHKILLCCIIYVVECEPQLYLMDASAVVLLPFMAVLHTHTHTHTLLVLQVGLNISFEMSPAKHQISSSSE